MASKISGSRKLKRKSLPKFEADVYSKIPSDGLIVFAVYYLIEHKIEITLEDIVSLCFLLFPHKFGLKRYPKWPDSAPISRHWGDVRRKRYVIANDYLGYRLTTKGTRLVRRVAKVLGVKLLKPINKIQPVQKEKATSPTSVKKAHPVRVKKVSSAPVKQTLTPEIKVLPVKQKEKKQSAHEEKVTQLELIKAHPVHAKKAPSILEKKTQVLPVSKPIQPVKAPSQVQVKETKPAKPVIIQPVKVEKVQAEPVSREAKERAGKFTHMMERSDAYIHYKKNGSKSNISEFDFRSLLLCTMESSAETLTRNVELFKGYAGIHHRQDLIAFMVFCEEKFSHLLKPARKAKK